ncbi:hypothetical protein [Carboxylicivirga marina]|uniref:hypothetical protein n=1 Tax=Carboxylicivirga marina TaxID=2800988 RepID=UPI0025994F6B|nr:hypothetical protein [uncultured Carboxylicivirga sp.]
MKNFSLVIILLILIFCPCNTQSQETVSNWDNQFFIGNKVTWGSENWRYSGELQTRFVQNYQSLDRWFVEGVATYMASQHYELVPDLRISVRPEFMEYRPGFGVIRKDILGKGENRHQQFVQQLKYQADIGNSRVNHGLRYILFYNNVLNEKLIATGIGGVFYSWKPNFNGVEYIRAGGGLAYIISDQHTINFTYFVGAADIGDDWVYSGSFVVQLIINIRKAYKYIPAKYIMF